eukprot:2507334-Pyramimonas_sp.AAC.1
MGTPGMPVELAGIPERAGSAHGTGPLPACRLECTSFPSRSRFPLVMAHCLTSPWSRKWTIFCLRS